MKLGMPIAYGQDFEQTIENLVQFEQAGLDRVMIPEAYGFDAVTQMGYVAARTSKLELAFGILPMFTRTPTNLAMTAAGLDYVSDGRCILGIGASGPQVIEGFHGVRYDAPVGRAREHAEICRRIWRRDNSPYHGRYYHLPLRREDGGTGLGKPLKLLNYPVRENIPLLLAAIGPRNVELAAEIFDEWQPFLFVPELCEKVFGESLAAGTAKRDAALGRLGISVQTTLLITDDQQEAAAALEAVRHHAALYIGGMGARGANFYNTLAARYGYAEEARAIQDLYLAGRKAQAAAAVPVDFAQRMSLIGTAEFVAERLKVYAEAGVTCLLVSPAATSHQAQRRDVATLKSDLWPAQPGTAA
jgi:F420-dependent oxidoreductase-like protein